MGLLLQFFAISACYCISQCHRKGIRRDYFLAVEEQWWDYAPSKQNLITNDTSFSDQRLITTQDRIGSKYMKAIIKQYTDKTFKKEIKPEPWRGFVGPLMKGETYDVLYVHFLNRASRPYGLHPHGVQYYKDSEGALYADGTRGADKLDDTVPPGATYTYKWSMLNSFAPTEDDDNCVPQGYHPHIRSHKDVDTGMAGILLVCKPGTLNPDNSRKDVDREFSLYADIINETNSWLIEKSLTNCLNPAKCKQLYKEKNSRFIASTLIYQINGYMFGNLPDFEVYEGENVAFYAMGLLLGVHVIGIQGHTLEVNHKRSNSYQFGVAVFEGLNMVARNPGRWLLYCRVANHFRNGMAAFLTVHPSKKYKYPPQSIYGNKRVYYIAVEEVVWNYRPSGRVLARVGKGSEERDENDEQFFIHEAAVGGEFIKAIFKEYTDDTFTTPIKRCSDDIHMGILGPAVKVEKGDRLEIILKNKGSRPYSFNPFGLDFYKNCEGALYKNYRNSSKMYGAMTMPGKIKEYVFYVSENAGPAETDPQCITSMYQSFGDYVKDVYSGLIGPLLICKPGTLDEHDRQKGIDRELYVLGMVWSETEGWYINQSLARSRQQGKKVNNTLPEFRNVNTMKAINGLMYGNNVGFDMCLGDKVAWHMMDFGDRFDTTVFEGNNIQYDGRQVDFVAEYPGKGETVYMEPDNPGKWLFYAGNLDYQTNGMVTHYNVHLCHRDEIPEFFQESYNRVLKIYIAAVEVEWDYIPENFYTVTGMDLRDPDTPGNVFVRNDGQFIGSKYKKAVYREFTDDTFTEQVPRSKKDHHLGILGPFIRASVGDIIEIVYKNKASFYNSISLHNLPGDNQMIKQQKYGIKPGHIAKYRWVVPKRSGPGPNEPNCVGYLYDSPVFPERDISTGLLGPLIICREGVVDDYGRRQDEIDREFATAFVVFDENESPYFDYNLAQYAPNRTNPKDSIFEDANSRDTINGYSFQNIPDIKFKVGENVAWYTYAMGTASHSNHIHGETFVQKTTRAFRNDVLGLNPGGAETFEMVGDNPGIWMLHCHVGLHSSDGMYGVYTVLPTHERYSQRYKRNSMRDTRRRNE